MTSFIELLSNPWVVVGFTGQLVFGARFLVQWVASEHRGRSTIPVSFWYLSLIGSGLLLAYAIVRKDPVFILGQCFGSIVYTRNLVLLGRARDRAEEDTAESTSDEPR